MGSRKVWLGIAVVWLAVNIGGIVMAVNMSELQHAGVHFLLLLPGMLVLSRLLASDERAAAAGAPAEYDDRLGHLEQTIDSVAIEIERIGESQRFMAKMAEKEREGLPRT